MNIGYCLGTYMETTKKFIPVLLLASLTGLFSFSTQAEMLLAQAQIQASAKHCNNPEYLLLEDQFSQLESAKKEHFFVLDKRCMLELGLDQDEIVERRTIFLMGSMNYEHYGVVE